jgi:hypothetical protein
MRKVTRKYWWLPVTHSPPADPADAIEIPAATKTRLGLDGERSWIVITEANEFVWPGPDLRTVPGRDESTIAYGPLAPRFFAHVRDKFLERDQREKSGRVKRTDRGAKHLTTSKRRIALDEAENLILHE